MDLSATPAASTGLPDPTTLRRAERFALMLRPAKLVGESGEFLCVVRDVSITGVRLRLFHALPRESRFALELSNGDFYFIEKVWQRDDQAGFRFSAPVDVSRFIAEPSIWPRRPLRVKVDVPALVVAQGSSVQARIRDLSLQGARIETDRLLALGQPLVLRADGLPDLEATVCWRSLPGYGLALQRRFGLDELARLLPEIGLRPHAPEAMRI